MRHRLQRRHGQGRHLLSDDGEEASPRPGSGDGEPAALHLSGRFRRRQPAAMAGSLSRQDPFRPHLLQPGQYVGAGHPADRLRHGLVHRGRRLCAGDERRDRHRAQAGHDLPRRPAAGEGRDRRDRQRRGPGRRRCACPHIGRRRPLCAQRQPRARHGPAHRRQPQLEEEPLGLADRPARAELRRRGTLWRRAAGQPHALTTCAR